MAVSTVVEAKYVADVTSYVRGVRQAAASTQEFAREVPRTAATVQQLQSAMGTATSATRNMARELPKAVQGQDQLKASSVGLAAALGTLGALIGAKAVGAVKKYAMQGIAAARQYEQTVISIEGIFQGTGMSMEAAADKTKTYLADLRDFAAKTPFELPQVLDAVKRLLSIGYAADDVKDRLLPAVGDIVAALGQPPHAVSAVVYAFGQMKSAGRVLTQDLMQIGTALPGFNAKMALATKLFDGDMQALSKAMETGALDSTKAIDVIIEAMQDFGGAAGAMERQSQTLQGVMSTFSDVVNNALIDGLMPSLPVLSQTLNDVMPEVEALATAFAQALGPSLIDGANTMGKLAPVLTNVLPPIIEIIGHMSSLADVLVTLSPALEFVASLVGMFAEALSGLPAPVYAALAALLALRMGAKKLGLDATTASTQVGSAFMRMNAMIKTSLSTLTASVLVSATSIRTGLELMRVGAVSFARTFVAAMKSAAAAVKGFMLSLGPVGWAIAAASVAFEVLAGKSAAAEAMVEQLKGTVDETTGALTRMSAQMMATQFRKDLSADDIATLAQYGITIEGMTTAAMQGGAAAVAMEEKLRGLAFSAEGAWSAATGGPHYMTILRNFQGARGAVEATQTALDQEALAAKDAANAMTLASQERSMAARLASDVEVESALKSRAAFMSGTAEYRRSAIEAAKSAGIKVRADQTLTAATKALQDAYTGTQAAFDRLNQALSAEATMDAARQSISDLSKSLKENGRTLDENTDKGRSNRAAVREAIRSYADYAASLKDPQDQQKALEEGEKKLREVLGKKYDKSEMTRAFEEAKTETKTYAAEWQKAATEAKKAGNDVGLQFIEGIISALQAQKGAVESAGAEVGAAVATGASGPDGTDSDSPSKKGIRIGKEFIAGLTKGLDQIGLLKGKGANLGTALVEAARQALSAGESVRGTLDRVMGGLPQAPSPLEMVLGGPKKAEAWRKKHEADLMELGRMADQLDAALSALGQSREALSAIREASSRGEFTLLDAAGNRTQMDSPILEAFGSKGDIQSAIAMYGTLSDAVKQYYDGLIAAANAAGDTAGARRFTAARQTQLDGLKTQVQGIIDIKSRLQNAHQALEDENNRHAQRIDEINRQYDGLISSAEKSLAALESRWDGVIAGIQSQLDAANKAFEQENAVLQRLIQERDGFLERIKGGFTGFVNDLNSNEGDVVAAMADRLKKIQEYAANIRALAAGGLNRDLLRQIIEAGPSGGGGMAAALVAGGAEAISEVNALQEQLTSEVASFGEFASSQYYDIAIAQQEAIVAPLQASVAALQTQLAAANAARASEVASMQAHIAQLHAMREAAIAAENAQHEANKAAITERIKVLEGELTAAAEAVQAHFAALGVTMPDEMAEVATNAINSFIRAINAKKGPVQAAARGLARAAKEAFRAEFDIASPSRVMMEMGDQVAAGLIKGMERSIPMVEDAARSMAAAAMSGSPHIDYAATAGSGVGSVVIGPGAVQVNLSGSMDNLSATEIQRIVDDSLLQLAREIRRSA